MVDFEGPDFWMRRLGLIMVSSESSYLSTGLNSNDQNEFGDATCRLPKTTMFEYMMKEALLGF